MRPKHRLLLALTPFVCLSLFGCGPGGPERFHVSGQVTHKGQPVPAGTIIFEPDFSKGNDGPQGRALIKAGAFDTAAADGIGTVGGPHNITILGTDGQNPTETSPQGKPLFAPFITTAELPKGNGKLDFTVP